MYKGKVKVFFTALKESKQPHRFTSRILYLRRDRVAAHWNFKRQRAGFEASHISWITWTV